MDEAIVNVIDKCSLEEVYTHLSKYGKLIELSNSFVRNYKKNGRIYVGLISEIHKPKQRSHSHIQHRLVLRAENVNQNGTKDSKLIRLLFIGKVVQDLLKQNLKKGDVVAILNPKVFHVVSSGEEETSLAVGPLNTVLWLFRNVKITDNEKCPLPAVLDDVIELSSNSEVQSPPHNAFSNFASSTAANKGASSGIVGSRRVGHFDEKSVSSPCRSAGCSEVCSSVSLVKDNRIYRSTPANLSGIRSSCFNNNKPDDICEKDSSVSAISPLLPSCNKNRKIFSKSKRQPNINQGCPRKEEASSQKIFNCAQKATCTSCCGNREKVNEIAQSNNFHHKILRLEKPSTCSQFIRHCIHNNSMQALQGNCCLHGPSSNNCSLFPHFAHFNCANHCCQVTNHVSNQSRCTHDPSRSIDKSKDRVSMTGHCSCPRNCCKTNPCLSFSCRQDILCSCFRHEVTCSPQMSCCNFKKTACLPDHSCNAISSKCCCNCSILNSCCRNKGHLPITAPSSVTIRGIDGTIPGPLGESESLERTRNWIMQLEPFKNPIHEKTQEICISSDSSNESTSTMFCHKIVKASQIEVPQPENISDSLEPQVRPVTSVPTQVNYVQSSQESNEPNDNLEKNSCNPRKKRKLYNPCNTLIVTEESSNAIIEESPPFESEPKIIHEPTEDNETIDNNVQPKDACPIQPTASENHSTVINQEKNYSNTPAAGEDHSFIPNSPILAQRGTISPEGGAEEDSSSFKNDSTSKAVSNIVSLNETITDSLQVLPDESYQFLSSTENVIVLNFEQDFCKDQEFEVISSANLSATSNVILNEIADLLNEEEVKSDAMPVSDGEKIREPCVDNVKYNSVEDVCSPVEVMDIIDDSSHNEDPILTQLPRKEFRECSSKVIHELPCRDQSTLDESNKNDEAMSEKSNETIEINCNENNPVTENNNPVTENNNPVTENNNPDAKLSDAKSQTVTDDNKEASLTSGGESFYDAKSNLDSGEKSRGNSEEKWIMKHVKDLASHASVVDKLTKLNAIVPLKGPMDLRLYRPFAVTGIIIDIVPSLDDPFSILRGICHQKCRIEYSFNEFSDMEEMDYSECYSCRLRPHRICPKCFQTGTNSPLCLFFKFDLHLLVDNQVLRIELECQSATDLLGCSPATYLRCYRRILKKLKKIIFNEPPKSKNLVVHLNALIKPVAKNCKTVLTFHGTKLNKHLTQMGNPYKYVIPK